jgi:hypothetical protein
MDQKVTNQAVLGELDARGVKFLTLRMRSPALVLTVVDFADEAFIENADVHSSVGRRDDAVFVTVTLIGVSRGPVGVACSAQ